MKITSTTPIQQISDHQGSSRAAEARQEPRADRVTLSSDASFLGSVRDSASPAPFRQDLVNDISAQIQAGTFESGVDMDHVLDSMLADL